MKEKIYILRDSFVLSLRNLLILPLIFGGAFTAGAHKLYKDNCIIHSTPYKEVKEAELLLMKENGKPRRFRKW